jgi:hypothetical protein
MAFNFNLSSAVFNNITAETALANPDCVQQLHEIYEQMTDLIMSSTESSEDINILFMINALSDELYQMCDRVSVEIDPQENEELEQAYDELGTLFYRAFHTSDWMLRAWRSDSKWETGLCFEEKLNGILAKLSKQED